MKNIDQEPVKNSPTLFHNVSLGKQSSQDRRFPAQFLGAQCCRAPALWQSGPSPASQAC